VNIAAALLLALIFGLLLFDWATLKRRGRRMLLLESAIFAAGAFFIVFPDVATRVAHAVGIGRGVDFLLYPLVIWLVRESLAQRRRRWEDAERLTQVVRAIALREAVMIAPEAPQGAQGDGAAGRKSP
jgi:hypothetical protein